MGNRGGILVTAGALALLTACSTPAPVAPSTTTTPASAKPPTTVPSSDAPALGNGPGSQPPTTPQPPPPHSPDKVTSACPFLGVADISGAMGAALDAWAVEEKPDPKAGVTTYHCSYPSRVGGRQVHDLWVDVVPGTKQLASLLAEWTADCVAPASPITVPSATARTCDLKSHSEHDAMVLVVKQSHGQTRLAELDLRPNRADVYTKIAQLLADRL
ncbi:hypothetical protein AB0C38_35805 [Amycolatopsis sp. NPDC048633]|uniref:hypothetical protein n=1 Tax=Amycolatopsis sp. NPDC048633 TaxID=3157095 RepID=UPI00340CF76C